MNDIYQDLLVVFSRSFLRLFLVSAMALLVSTIALAGVLVGRVVAVTDGDTIKVLDTANVEHIVRLSGIDAPEKKMPFGHYCE